MTSFLRAGRVVGAIVALQLPAGPGKENPRHEERKGHEAANLRAGNEFQGITGKDKAESGNEFQTVGVALAQVEVWHQRKDMEPDNQSTDGRSIVTLFFSRPKVCTFPSSVATHSPAEQ